MEPIIRVRELYKVFGPNPQEGLRLIEDGLDKDTIFERTGNTVGVKDCNLDIAEGEIFVVMGLSGSGKSTLVRLLNRLIEPTAGTVEVRGRDVTRMSQRDLIRLRSEDLAMVFQSFALMPHKTVIDNAALGLEIAGVGRTRRRERAQEALDQVGLKAHARSYPDELSGGMQQRVGLARALATDPSIMLMDEAFSALDPLIRTEMQDRLLDLQREHRRTVVFISHDLDEAIRIGDRIAIMQGGEVVQVGTPKEIITHPANEYVRSFFHGVDITQVFQACDIMDSENIPVLDADTTAGEARNRIAHVPGNEAVIVDAGGRFQSVVQAKRLGELTLDRAASEVAVEVEAVPEDTALADLPRRAAQSPVSIPVVDGEGRFRGLVTLQRLVEALDRSRNAAAANGDY
ncbi:glycine betaine/L-proline ABC transporter ATP-binding protein ProV [Thioalkalivibrio sp. AKL10]|uniref:glycine betaine/L-proline ABC transporter ATP-binding protein ProV n=1 Tax=Thioalkalivibrio sp. AKL10 TaxID=1158158 RepID=UPI00035C8BA4|nr:glycine betaine/L-proline ABC transporter ATP-binding protein ProV [Thioalkalivibrio sp. AKL10]